MTNEEVLRTHNDLEMMRRPVLWPLAILPLKNPSAFRTSGGLGVLWTTGENEYVFREDVNLLKLPSLSADGGRTGGDELLVQLVEEGWLVD
jgi:hypothetical protein